MVQSFCTAVILHYDAGMGVADFAAVGRVSTLSLYYAYLEDASRAAGADGRMQKYGV